MRCKILDTRLDVIDLSPLAASSPLTTGDNSCYVSRWQHLHHPCDHWDFSIIDYLCYYAIEITPSVLMLIRSSMSFRFLFRLYKNYIKLKKIFCIGELECTLRSNPSRPNVHNPPNAQTYVTLIMVRGLEKIYLLLFVVDIYMSAARQVNLPTFQQRDRLARPSRSGHLIWMKFRQALPAGVLGHMTGLLHDRERY